MPATTLRREESLGLALALLGHAAVIAWLIWPRAPTPIVLPERMSVTISDDVGLEASAPQQLTPAPDAGPVQGEAPPPPAPTRQVQPPTPAAGTPPRPSPAQVAKPQPRPAPAVPTRPSPPAAKPGASAFDNAFKTGIPQAKPNGTAAAQTAPITGAVRNSLAGAVARQLKPKWRGRAPSGLDAEKLVTILTWDLNPDGSLAGSPRVVRQEGITPANQAQASRHAEEAIRAVRLAAPFDLPEQYYTAWKHVTGFRFDRSLGQ